MKNIIILGAGGHTRSLIMLLKNAQYQIDYIVDINQAQESNEKINGIRIVGNNYNESQNFNVLSIGDNGIREQYFLKHKKVSVDNIIHSEALLATKVNLGCSNQIFPHVFINEDVAIGDNNIINTGVIIEHETCIGNHNHIAIGSVIAGRVKIENRCFIGANTTIIDQLNICSDVILGAGSVVIKDIQEPGTYVGNPIRKIK